MKVACFSVAVMDFFPRQNQYYPGGNSLNQAIRFRHLGCQSAFVGALGTDDAGERLEALFLRETVDISHLHRVAGCTAHNQIINDDSGERYGVEGTWAGGVYETFAMDADDWAYLSGFEIWATHANSPGYLDALERKVPAQFMSVDFLHLRDFDLLQKSLGIVNIAYFGGTVDMIADLARIARMHPGLIVLTLGALGSMAFEGERVYSQPALIQGRVVDATGCGDAFQAAFTASYYSTRDIPAALLAGSRWGARAAMHYGGVPWQ